MHMKPLILAMVTLVSWSCTYAADNAADNANATDASAARGEHVFSEHCATCHGDTGQGLEPWYPSLQRLAGLRDPAAMVETVLSGRFRRGGEIDGHTIPIMPAWGQLTDADVAAIVNYVQQNWGEGGQIKTEDVSKARATLWEID